MSGAGLMATKEADRQSAVGAVSSSQQNWKFQALIIRLLQSSTLQTPKSNHALLRAAKR
jgi:hypothetical protein